MYIMRCIYFFSFLFSITQLIITSTILIKATIINILLIIIGVLKLGVYALGLKVNNSLSISDHKKNVNRLKLSVSIDINNNRNIDNVIIRTSI